MLDDWKKIHVGVDLLATFGECAGGHMRSVAVQVWGDWLRAACVSRRPALRKLAIRNWGCRGWSEPVESELTIINNIQ